jgi:hypothetical protein
MPKDWASPHRCYFANTYFFMKLSGEGDMTGYSYAAVKRWTRRVKVFECDRMIIPINAVHPSPTSHPVLLFLTRPCTRSFSTSIYLYFTLTPPPPTSPSSVASSFNPPCPSARHG